MDSGEKAEMLAALDSGRHVLAASVEGVAEDIAARSPAPGRWSILECVEHVARAEDYLFGQIVRATAGEPVVNLQREAAIRARGADRTRKVPAPAEGLPEGRFAGLAEALGHFLESRARTIRFVEECAADLRAQATTHPLLGAVNCHETLLIMAAHPRRHAQQIAEIRAALAPGQE